jgi:hypothetical protein
MSFDQNNTGGRSMTKVTVRLSPECDAALADAGAYGINNSEFIRAAILYYYSSGSWKPPVPAGQADKSICFTEECAASDNTSDMMSDRPKAETSQFGSKDVEKVRSWQQLSSPPPQLKCLNANPRSAGGIGKNPWVLAISALAIVAMVYMAFSRSWEPRSI